MSVKAFLNGVAWGFVLGVLFAPASGEETRKNIAKKASDIRDNVKNKYNDIASTVNEKYGNVKEKIEEIKNRGEEAYLNGKAEANIYE